MRPRFLVPLLVLSVACRGAQARPEAEAADSGIVRSATVIAFTLQASDTLGEESGAEKLREFEAYTELVFPLLEEQGLAVRSTRSDTIVVAMEQGPSRTIMLRGLDYPFGYVLVEPGFPETILTGVVTDEELLEEVSFYFGLDDETGEEEQRKQVVIR